MAPQQRGCLPLPHEPVGQEAGEDEEEEPEDYAQGHAG